jgi:hypothetical protein
MNIEYYEDIWNKCINDEVDILGGMKGKAGESGVMMVDKLGNLINISNNTIVEMNDGDNK